MELNEVILKRRSVRAYQKTPVSRELIDQLIKAAVLAPTWKNSQTGRYHVVMTEEMLDKVRAEGLAPFNAENCKDAPVLIITSFVSNRSGFERDGTPSNELGNGWGCYDLGLQNQNLLLKAADLGLATLVMGIRDADKLKELLSIPEEETVVSVICVGYGDAEPAMPKRKEVKEITTYQ